MSFDLSIIVMESFTMYITTDESFMTWFGSINDVVFLSGTISPINSPNINTKVMAPPDMNIPSESLIKQLYSRIFRSTSRSVIMMTMNIII